MELIPEYGHRRSYHKDPPWHGAILFRRLLYSRLHSNDRHGDAAPVFLCCNAGRRIAGDHNGVDLLFQKKSYNFCNIPLDLLLRLLSVRHMSLVRVIDKIRIRHDLDCPVKDRQASDP